MSCEHVKTEKARKGETITATAGVWICPWCRANQLAAELAQVKQAGRNLLQYLDDHDWGTVPVGVTADVARIAFNSNASTSGGSRDE